MIEFQDVTVCYEPQKRHPVRSLDGLSLKIERGDWVFLVGPSGAGKSSLLKLIFAGTPLQSGRVVVDGEDITYLSPRQVPLLRRKIGIVFQDFQLLGEKTAWENVAFALRVIGTPQNVIIREVPRALETVGLTHRAEAFPHELSGGEQQRIAIARAIVNDPKILLTDEPTGNLDPKTAREVGQLLTRINRERGTTIVMATHDRSFVNDMARRVVRLKEGRVVSDQNPGNYGEDAVLASPSPIFLENQAAPSMNGFRESENKSIEENHEKTAPSHPIMDRFEARMKRPVESMNGSNPETEDLEVVIEKNEVAEGESAAPLALIETVRVEESAPIIEAELPVPESSVAETVFLKTEFLEEVVAPPEQLESEMTESERLALETPIASPDSAVKLWDAPDRFSRRVDEAALAAARAASESSSQGAEISVSNWDNEAFSPRPMARRIDPLDAPRPLPPSEHALDPNAQIANPNAPLGSPENPIVQYE